eukprot:TRINITY_DN781879_c0_g1_i1.p1 TRINITY_DN781879_c0_g1~~TRINITY_DN781879_c0_g1_i1.p1  ORF type:complete len:567 (-),score=129.66 TRINITY_DN781879_c0_g1_i1:163-1803(-)
MLSRKISGKSSRRDEKKPDNKLNLEQFIENRDYTGAITLLEFERRSGDESESNLQWTAYCAFHLGDYQKALDACTQLRDGGMDTSELRLYIAACLYYLCKYKECETEALKAKSGSLQNRILFHVAHKLNDENKLMMFHQKLSDQKEDRLSLAAIHYLRSHFQEATDIYKRMLVEYKEDTALNVYVAMCYYKLDYYDVSNEILNVYLQSYPESPFAVNLKACNQYKMYTGKAAEAELKPLIESDHAATNHPLIKHNLVVFRDGKDALQVLPSLMDVIPESKLNLVIYHLRNDDVQAAFDLMDFEPSSPQEYILKAVVNARIGQETGSRDHLRMAQQYFQLVGASASECDTIPGRQCMASNFFLIQQFQDVNIYFNSIKTYLYNNDDFNWNYGIALAATGSYKEAEETLSLVTNEDYRKEYCYISWLCRCYIMNKKPRQAWDMYIKMQASNERFNLLQLIANDCYKMGSFYFSAKAFDVLERLDPDPEYLEGKRGACIGYFQQVIAAQEPKDNLHDIIDMLCSNSNPQLEYIVRVMKKWCVDNGMNIE